MYILEYWDSPVDPIAPAYVPWESFTEGCRRTKKIHDISRDIYRSREEESYQIVKNNSSGNCLFESLFSGLYHNLYDQTADQLRKKVVEGTTMQWYRRVTKNLVSTVAFDSQFVTSRSWNIHEREESSAPSHPLYYSGLTPRYLALYRRFMIQDETYGTAVELMAFTDIYTSVQVIVHQTDPRIPRIYFYGGRQHDTDQGGCLGTRDMKNINILWTGGEHYEFLRPL